MTHSSPELRVQRYKFTFRLKSDLMLNEYSGSMLRGAFGAQLRRWACITKAESCDGCKLRSTCPFGVIFSPEPVIKHGMQVRYVIEPPRIGKRLYRAGEQFSFNMVLIGNAIEQLSLIIMVWEQLFKYGIKNRHNGCGDLINVAVSLPNQEIIIYTPPKEGEDATKLSFHVQNTIIPSIDNCKNLTIHFVTPYRVSYQNKHLTQSSQLTEEILLQSIYRRYIQLSDSNKTDIKYKPPKAGDCNIKISENFLRNFNWQRYSNKQQQKMSFNGFVGRLVLSGEDILEWWPLIYLSQLWHIGQKVSFGLGKIEVKINY